MTFEGTTSCPVCKINLERDLRDVLRKTEDQDTVYFECSKCGARIAVNVSIVHKIKIVKDE